MTWSKDITKCFKLTSSEFFFICVHFDSWFHSYSYFETRIIRSFCHPYPLRIPTQEYLGMSQYRPLVGSYPYRFPPWSIWVCHSTGPWSVLTPTDSHPGVFGYVTVQALGRFTQIHSYPYSFPPWSIWVCHSTGPWTVHTDSFLPLQIPTLEYLGMSQYRPLDGSHRFFLLQMSPSWRAHIIQHPHPSLRTLTP